jgi:hypothetical protein
MRDMKQNQDQRRYGHVSSLLPDLLQVAMFGINNKSEFVVFGNAGRYQNVAMLLLLYKHFSQWVNGFLT